MFYVKRLIFLSSFNQISVFWANWHNAAKYEMLRKSIQWEPSSHTGAKGQEEGNRRFAQFMRTLRKMLFLRSKLDLPVCSELDAYHKKYYGVICNTHASSFTIITTCRGLGLHFIVKFEHISKRSVLEYNKSLLVTDILQKYKGYSPKYFLFQSESISICQPQ
jgi:hypothetical protein